jgi:hypothetical protein
LFANDVRRIRAWRSTIWMKIVVGKGQAYPDAIGMNSY